MRSALGDIPLLLFFMVKHIQSHYIKKANKYCFHNKLYMCFS